MKGEPARPKGDRVQTSMSTSAREDAAMIEMHDLLARQRAAFMDELPVGIAVRKDRLRRAAAMIVDHATRFCDALSEDFGHRSREQSLVTDIAGSVAPINHAIKHVDAGAAREKRTESGRAHV